MKKILNLFFAFLLLATVNASAQDFDEWFDQKDTQKRYLRRQIAYLQLYLRYVKQGYSIAQKGLNTIENIKNGNFNLHRDFFGSLKNVNPLIANSAKVADIIAFQYYITRDMKNVYQFCQSSKRFTPNELYYVAKVHANMLFLCDANISELRTIIAKDKTEMKDDERLKVIDKLYDDMQDKYAFVKSFGNDAKDIARGRSKEEATIQHLQKTYEIF
jgi:hypothetical protein